MKKVKKRKRVVRAKPFSSRHGWVVILATVLLLVVISGLIYFYSLPSREVAFCQELALVNSDLSVRHDVYYDYMESHHFLTDCLIDLAVKRNDLKICDYLSSRFVENEYYVPVCYGVVSQSLSFCNDKYLRDDPRENITRTRCVAGVGYGLHDSSVCQDSHPPMIRSCIDMVAELTGNYEMCEFYSRANFSEDSGSYEDECLFSVLTFGHRGSTRNSVFLDYNVCFEFEKKVYSDSCFHAMALRHRDLDICDYIDGDSTRRECRQAPQRGWSLGNSPYQVVR